MLTITNDQFDWTFGTNRAKSVKPTQKSLIARLLAALHHSRRLQAEREIKRYQFMIDKAHDKAQAGETESPR
jgi:hypothetical protein